LFHSYFEAAVEIEKVMHVVGQLPRVTRGQFFKQFFAPAEKLATSKLSDPTRSWCLGVKLAPTHELAPKLKKHLSDDFVKKCPKTLFVKIDAQPYITVEQSSPKMWATYVCDFK
jgi:hypothetical protein